MPKSSIAFLDCHPRRGAVAVATHDGALGWGRGYSAEVEPPNDESPPSRLLLRALAAHVKYRGPAILLLPPSSLLVKSIRVPAAGRRRADVLAFEAGQAIPCPLAAVAWDAVPATRGDSGEQLVFAARLAEVEQWCEAAELAGSRVEAVWPGPLALLAGLRRSMPPGERRLLLALGDEAHVLWQVDGERVGVRLFPAAAARDATALAAEITRSRVHLSTNTPGEPQSVTGLWLVGPDQSKLPTDELARHLQMPVHSWRSDDPTLAALANLPPDTALRMHGAAALAFGPDLPRADLTPPARKRRNRWRREVAWWSAAAVLAVAAMLPPIVAQRSTNTASESQIAALEAELAPLRQREAEARARAERRRELAAQMNELAEIQRSRTHWLAIMADLQQRLGSVSDAWLDRLESTSVTAGEVGAREPRLTMAGRLLDRAPSAEGVSAGAFERMRKLFASLAESPHFQGLRGERISTAQPGVLRFDCELVIRGGENRLP